MSVARGSLRVVKRLPGIVVVAVLVVVAVAGINSWTGSGPGLGGTLAPGAPEVVRLSPTEALAASPLMLPEKTRKALSGDHRECE